jgi:hypothetical protein
MRKIYLSRSQSRGMAAEYPVADPFGGPAFGEFTDVGSAISAGASLIGGAMSSKASKSASNAQQDSAAAAMAEQARQYDQTRADNAPFRNTGVAANARLAYLLGLNSSPDATGSGKGTPEWQAIYDRNMTEANRQHQAMYGMPFTSSPDEAGKANQLKNIETNTDTEWAKTQANKPAPNDSAYGSLLRKFGLSDLNSDVVYNSGLEFGRKEGEDAINARALANGGYDSGATLKALTRFGNDYGSTKAEGAYNRYNTDNTNIYNRLAGVSGAGQTATNTITSAGVNAASNTSNLLTDAGNSRAAGIVGGANAWGGAMSGIQGAYNSYQNQQNFNSIFNRLNGGGSNYGGGYGLSTNYADGHGPI